MDCVIYFVSEENLIPSSCVIIDKAFQTLGKLLVLCPEKDTLDALDKALWTFSSLKFIPHLTSYDPKFDTPVLLTDNQDDLPHYQNAVFLYIPDNPPLTMQKLVFIISDKDVSVFDKLKTLESKLAAYEIKKWQQDHNGKWNKI